jgi:hypothetical protein
MNRPSGKPRVFGHGVPAANYFDWPKVYTRFAMSTNSNGIDVRFHGTASGMCPIDEKEGEGFVVSFTDGTVTESFLSFRGLQKLIKLKMGQAKKARQEPTKEPRVAQEVKVEARPAVPVPAPNGPR